MRDWTPVPFWFAVLAWWLIVGTLPVLIAAYTGTLAITTATLATCLVVALIAAVITRRRHK